MAEIQVMKNILGENDRVAAENQALFAEKNVYVINLMGSPGAGKTSVLEKTMEKLKDLANLPSRETLLSMVANVFSAPIAGFARAVQAIADKAEAPAEA